VIAKIPGGPLAAARAAGQQALDAALAELRRETVRRPAIFVGTGTCGLGAGAGKTLEAVRAYLKRNAIDADVVEVGCIGLCSEEPILDVQLPGRARISFRGATADKVTDLLTALLAGQLPTGPRMDNCAPLGQFAGVNAQPWADVPMLEKHPFLLAQRRVVLATSGRLDPSQIDEYIAWGGYAAAAKALKTMTPDEVCDAVEASGLRGRGGGGFPTGRKWKFARKAEGRQKYLICNADEGDPGAFMDRAVGESDPHRLIEGMVIAAYAIGATKA